MRAAIIILFLLLAGCASAEFSGLKLSKASITEVSVESLESDSVTLKFNYSISDYSANEGLYYCKIMFVALEHDMNVAHRKAGQPVCNIINNSDSQSFSSVIPTDNSYVKFPNPRQAFVAIFQKTGMSRRDDKIIGKSEIVLLKAAL